MIGGIPRNLGKGAAFTDSEFVVLEGDEYDTAFFDKRSKLLHYLPEVVIVNNIEFDHADIYDSLDEIKLTFKRLLNIVPRNVHRLPLMEKITHCRWRVSLMFAMRRWLFVQPDSLGFLPIKFVRG